MEKLSHKVLTKSKTSLLNEALKAFINVLNNWQKQKMAGKVR